MKAVTAASAEWVRHGVLSRDERAAILAAAEGAEPDLRL
jgi:hypothetical protein